MLDKQQACLVKLCMQRRRGRSQPGEMRIENPSTRVIEEEMSHQMTNLGRLSADVIDICLQIDVTMN